MLRQQRRCTIGLSYDCMDELRFDMSRTSGDLRIHVPRRVSHERGLPQSGAALLFWRRDWRRLLATVRLLLQPDSFRLRIVYWLMSFSIGGRTEVCKPLHQHELPGAGVHCPDGSGPSLDPPGVDE